MTGVEGGRWEFDVDDEWFGSDDDTDVDSDEVRKKRGEREIEVKKRCEIGGVVLVALLFVSFFLLLLLPSSLLTDPRPLSTLLCFAHLCRISLTSLFSYFSCSSVELKRSIWPGASTVTSNAKTMRILTTTTTTML